MDYCLNPYTGCAHGCIYCYATFIKRWTNHQEPWGSFVDVKINLIEVLSQEVKKKRKGMVCIGTVCDPYQPIEAEYQLTHGAIKILKSQSFPFHILTKSDLILRDIDLLKAYASASVEITITTLDDEVRELFEPGSVPVKNRLQAVKTLIKNRIATEVFFGPVLPYFSDRVQEIKKLFTVLERIGVQRVLVDKLNYLDSKISHIKNRLRDLPEVLNYYEWVQKNPLSYEADLRQKINEAGKGSNLTVEIIF